MRFLGAGTYSSWYPHQPTSCLLLHRALWEEGRKEGREGGREGGREEILTSRNSGRPFQVMETKCTNARGAPDSWVNRTSMLLRSLEFVNGHCGIHWPAIPAFFQQAFHRQQWGQRQQLPWWPGSAVWLRNLFWKLGSEPFPAAFPVVLKVSVINDLLPFF